MVEYRVAAPGHTTTGSLLAVQFQDAEPTARSPAESASAFSSPLRYCLDKDHAGSLDKPQAATHLGRHFPE